MIRKTCYRLLLILTILALVSLACELPIYIDKYGTGPRPTVKPEDANSEPVDEIVSEPVDENVSEPVEDISIEACVAKPDEYTWEFANVNNEGSNDTKEVCKGDFLIRNTSNGALYFKWFEHWDNGAMQDIGWMELYQRLAPGEEFSLYFGTQTWSTGDETVATFTKLTVFYALPDCAVLLVDEEYEAFWDASAMLLSDPCR